VARFLVRSADKTRGASALRVDYVSRWVAKPSGLPLDLYPPAVKLTPDMFVMKKEGNGDSSRQRVSGSD